MSMEVVVSGFLDFFWMVRMPCTTRSNKTKNRSHANVSRNVFTLSLVEPMYALGDFNDSLQGH